MKLFGKKNSSDSSSKTDYTPDYSPQPSFGVNNNFANINSSFPGSNLEEYSGFWRKALALMIDGFVISLLMLVVFVAIISFAGLGATQEQLILTIIGAYVIVLLYKPILESSKKQATIGKMVMGIKVIGASGGKISFLRALARFIIEQLHASFLVGYLISLFTAKKQSLHDIVCKTYVIKTGKTKIMAFFASIALSIGAIIVIFMFFGASIMAQLAGAAISASMNAAQNNIQNNNFNNPAMVAQPNAAPNAPLAQPTAPAEKLSITSAADYQILFDKYNTNPQPAFAGISGMAGPFFIGINNQSYNPEISLYLPDIKSYYDFSNRVLVEFDYIKNDKNEDVYDKTGMYEKPGIFQFLQKCSPNYTSIKCSNKKPNHTQYRREISVKGATLPSQIKEASGKIKITLPLSTRKAEFDLTSEVGTTKQIGEGQITFESVNNGAIKIATSNLEISKLNFTSDTSEKPTIPMKSGGGTSYNYELEFKNPANKLIVYYDATSAEFEYPFVLTASNATNNAANANGAIAPAPEAAPVAAPSPAN